MASDMHKQIVRKNILTIEMNYVALIELNEKFYQIFIYRLDINRVEIRAYRVDDFLDANPRI